LQLRDLVKIYQHELSSDFIQFLKLGVHLEVEI